MTTETGESVAVRNAEEYVLSSLLKWNEAIGDVVQFLRVEHFYADAHQKLFRAMLDLYDRGHPVDLVTLAQLLKERGHVEDVGYTKLADLWDLTASGANAEYYARMVMDASILRSLRHIAVEVQRDAENPTGPAREVLEEAEKKIFAIAQEGLEGTTVEASRAIGEAYDRIDARSGTGSATGIKTGFLDLDFILTGLQNSELTILGARPSVGKTALGMQIATHGAVDLGVTVLVVSLEQSRAELAERMMCSRGRIDTHRVRRGIMTADERSLYLRVGDAIGRAPLLIDDSPGQTMLRIASNARRLKSRRGLGLVVLDYLQLVEPSDKKDSRQEHVSGTAARLKHLARELKIPVLALAQVNRGAEDRQNHKPRLSDLRESGGLEAHADVVLLMHRPELYSDGDDPNNCEGVCYVNVAKQRNGPTGEVTLTFLKRFTRFENFAVAPAGYEVG